MTRKAFTIIELLVVIVIIIMLALMLYSPNHASSEARKVRCASNLAEIAKAASIYCLSYDSYPEPAAMFRGTEFLGTLYWTNQIKEPKYFACPATSHTGVMPASFHATGDYNQVSYASLCRGLKGDFAHRNTLTHIVDTMVNGSSALASDRAPINGTEPNHSDGVNIVFFDGHVEFWPNAQEYVGKNMPPMRFDQLQYMDSGEEKNGK